MTKGKKPDLPPLADRRPNPRKRVLFGGVVVYGQGAYSCGCKIRDLTTDGARIVVPAGQPLPADLYFINLRSQTGHKATLIWHHGTEAGLAFQSTFNLHALDDPGLGYLKRIWLAHT